MKAVSLPFDIRLMQALTWVLGGLVGTAILIWVCWWLIHRSVFDLNAIRIEGDVHHNNALTLRVNVVPKLSGNFLTVNLQQVQTAFETVPWVRKAVVRRQFPNRLRVTLQEHQAVAYWSDDSDAGLVNTFGEVFEANRDDVPEELPLLNGPTGQASLVLAGYQMLTPLFAKLDNSTLTRFELTRHGSWRAQLDSGATLELGQGSVEDISTRVRRFVATLAQVSSRFGRQLESADLRYGNGYAVKLRGIGTQ